MTVRKKALAKTVSWRFIASLTTAMLTWIVTGNFVAGLTVGGMEVIVKMVFYYLHERAWDRVEVE